MPDSVAFPLILGNFFVGTFLVFYIAAVAHAKGVPIVTGVGHGATLPKTYRNLMLYAIFMLWAAGSAGVAIFVVLTSLLIAPNLTGEDARLAAYLVAFMHTFIILSWAALGPLQVMYFRRLIRQAEAD